MLRGILLALLVSVASVSQACDVTPELGLSTRDTARLEGLEQGRLRGLAAVIAGPAQEADRAIVAELYANGLVPADEIAPGDYLCRTIKAGGLSPLVIYQNFRCEVRTDGNGLVLEKLTGSQRSSGDLISTEGGLVYRGALHYGNEDPIGYQGASERDQVACLARVNTDRPVYILEFPSPIFESFFDILTLTPLD